MAVLYVAMILTAGYLWTGFSYPARYIRVRKEGWDLYFYVAVRGLLLFAISLPIVLFVDTKDLGEIFTRSFNITGRDIKEWPVSIQELKLLFLAAISFLLAFIFGALTFLAYLVPPLREWETKNLSKRDETEDFLFKLACKSLGFKEDILYLSVTLKSKKVYVGMISDFSVDKDERSSIAITPLLSGYRDKDTLEVEYTFNYRPHYEEHYKNKENDMLLKFCVVIPMDQIEYMSYFDLEDHKIFQDKMVAENADPSIEDEFSIPKNAWVAIMVPLSQNIEGSAMSADQTPPSIKD